MNKLTNYVLSLLFLVSASVDAMPKFISLSTGNGLSNASVECIFQDYIGYLWVGTINGLNKYDGYRFTNYYNQRTDSNSLIKNDIQVIYEDSHRNLWIGSGGGLQQYNRKEDNFRFFKLPNGAFPVKALLEDGKNNFWIGTLGGGLLKFDYKKELITVVDYKELYHISISVLFEDNKGNIWIGTENAGIYCIDRNTNRIRNLDEKTCGFAFSKMKIRSISEDNKGNLWFGTYGNGIFSYNISKNLTKNEANLCSRTNNRLVSKIIIESNNTMWIGFDGAGILQYNIDTKEEKWLTNNPLDNSTIAEDAIKCIFFDNKKNLWAGMFNKGLSVTNTERNNNFELLTSESGNKNSLPNSNVTGIAADKNGNMWITTDGGGLCKMNKDKKHIVSITPKPLDNLNYNNALCALTDADGNIWGGYYKGGYIKIDPIKNSIQQFSDDAETISQTGIKDDIRVLLQDKKGNMWIGTNGQGVLKINTKTGQQERYTNDYLNIKTGIANNFIRSLYEDSKGYIWVGCTYGLSRIDTKNKHFLNFFEDRTDNTSLLSNLIHCITETANGYLCFGTAEGLCILTTPVWSDKYDVHLQEKAFSGFKNFSLADGLADRDIFSVLEDKDQNLWLGTGKGISVFNPKKEQFVNYSIQDIGVITCNTGACLKANNGRFYFGSTAGLISFFPDSVRSLETMQEVAITDIKVNFESIFSASGSKSVQYNNNVLELGYKHKSVNFEFSALELFYPNSIKYLYKLEGFDTKWNLTDASRRYATYTNLNPGTYKFLVKASNKNGIWNEIPLEIVLIIDPPFWKAIWFIVLCFVLVGSLVILYIQIRLKAIKKRNIRLESIVKDRTRELIEEREKQKKIEAEKNKIALKQKELETNQLKTEKELILIKNKNLQYELEQQSEEISKKNQELSTLAIQTTQKIEFLAKLKKQLIDIQDKTKDEASSMISALIKHIDKDSNIKKEWEQFEFHLVQSNQSFFNTLKERYPELTPHDLRMCAYLKMNLSNKEIAALQNISLRGIEKSRFRLRKKMHLENEENIITFLMDIH